MRPGKNATDSPLINLEAASISRLNTLAKTLTWSGKLAVFLLVTLASAQDERPPQPQPTVYSSAVPNPTDSPYPGSIQLSLDITNLLDHVQHVTERIPLSGKGQELVLLYPQWIPGSHAPTGTIARVAGLLSKVDGRQVQWTRDLIDPWALHVPLSPGAKFVELQFDYLSPRSSTEGRVEMSDTIASVEWYEVLMYPAGYFSRDIPFDVSVKLPDRWRYATALETKATDGSTVTFKSTTLNTLVDSPLDAGAYFKRYDLSPSPTNIVRLNIFADDKAGLELTPAEAETLKRLPVQAEKLFASHHYEHYDFLLILSNKVGGAGVEHHQSTAEGAPARYFAGCCEGDFLAHEYVHSWNGKFRRPADLWTPTFNVPMRDDLLWVYEGLTQYWGDVLAARSGMHTPGETHKILAGIASSLQLDAGRTWRPLIDTTAEEIIAPRHSAVSWSSWRRSPDYYLEGELVWLEVDVTIRELTQGRKSLDDFAKSFYSIYDGSFVTQTYTLDDLIEALNQIATYDWARFFRERVYDLHPSVPEAGLSKGGYSVAYTDNLATSPQLISGGDFSTSLGFSLAPSQGEGNGASVANVLWGSVAFRAGITPSMRLVSVGGKAFSNDALRAAILQSEHTRQPVQLLFTRDGKDVSVELAYFGGLRIPSLQRTQGTPDRLDDIFAPK